MFSARNLHQSERHGSDRHSNVTISPETAADLRRAGYHDGERLPRLGHHWANQPSSVFGRMMRWRSKSRSKRQGRN